MITEVQFKIHEDVINANKVGNERQAEYKPWRRVRLEWIDVLNNWTKIWYIEKNVDMTEHDTLLIKTEINVIIW